MTFTIVGFQVSIVRVDPSPDGNRKRLEAIRLQRLLDEAREKTLREALSSPFGWRF